MFWRLLRDKMDVKDAIKKRRSVRKYQDREISEELLKELLDAAILAPSGNNAQPWKYKILRRGEKRDILRRENIFKQDFVYTSPYIIVCCADPKSYPRAKFESDFDDPYEERALRDLAISSQNLVLRATELGLGSCYVGWMNKDKIKEILGIPENYIIPYVTTLGYPDEEPSATPRKSMDDILL